MFDDGSGNPVSVKTIIEPSPDLPQEQPATSGIFVSELDNSYFIGTGNISISAQTVNGETSVSSEHSGPKVEVVAGHDTIFYKDVTKIDWEPSESGERRYVQELVQVDQPSELTGGNSLTVWGDKNGDLLGGLEDELQHDDGTQLNDEGKAIAIANTWREDGNPS